MRYADYTARVEQAARWVEAGAYDRAIAAFAALVDQDIADLDKAMMCLNVATVYERLADDARATVWYERAIAYERPHRRAFAAEQHAAYLARSGRTAASRRLYRELLDRPELQEADRERIRHNLHLLGTA